MKNEIWELIKNKLSELIKDESDRLDLLELIEAMRLEAYDNGYDVGYDDGNLNGSTIY